jgi:hypothetical protein
MSTHYGSIQYDYTYGPDQYYDKNKRANMSYSQEKLNSMTTHDFKSQDRELMILARDFGLDESVANRIIYNVKRKFIEDIETMEVRYGKNMLIKYYETVRLRILNVAFKDD